jgi:hypothetical protein
VINPAVAITNTATARVVSIAAPIKELIGNLSQLYAKPSYRNLARQTILAPPQQHDKVKPSLVEG